MKNLLLILLALGLNSLFAQPLGNGNWRFTNKISVGTTNSDSTLNTVNAYFSGNVKIDGIIDASNLSDSISCVFALTKAGTLAYQDLLLDTRASFTNNMGLMLCDSAKLAAICGTVGSTNGYAADSILIQIRKITSPATSQITNGAGSLVATVEIHPPVDSVRYYVQTTEEKDIKLAEGDMIFAEITGISGTTTFTDLQLQILIEFEK